MPKHPELPRALQIWGWEWGAGFGEVGGERRLEHFSREEGSDSSNTANLWRGSCVICVKHIPGFDLFSVLTTAQGRGKAGLHFTGEEAGVQGACCFLKTFLETPLRLSYMNNRNNRDAVTCETEKVLVWLHVRLPSRIPALSETCQHGGVPGWAHSPSAALGRLRAPQCSEWGCEGSPR